MAGATGAAGAAGASPGSLDRWLVELDDGAYAVIDPAGTLQVPLDTLGFTPTALDRAAKTVLAHDPSGKLSTIEVSTGAKVVLGVKGTIGSFDEVGGITVYQPGGSACDAGGSVVRGPIAGPHVAVAPSQGAFFSRRFATSPGGRFVAWSREVTTACDPTASRVYVYDEQSNTVTPMLDSDDGKHESIVGALADGTGFLVQRSTSGAAPFSIVRVLWADLSSSVVYASLPEAVASGVGCDTSATVSPSGQFVCVGTSGPWLLDLSGSAPKPIASPLVGGRSVGRIVDTVTVLPPGPPEVCNFFDDDGDGSVDEGFDWSLSPWKTLHTFSLIGVVASATRLSDGSVAVAGTDSYGEMTDKGWVLRVDTTGALLAGPTLVPIPLAGGDGGFLVERDGDLVSVWNSTDYNGCKSGCPVVIRSLDKATLAVKSAGTTFASESITGCRSAAFSDGGILLGCHTYVGPDYQTRIVRLDAALTGLDRLAKVSVASGGTLVWGSGSLVQYATSSPLVTAGIHGAFDFAGPGFAGLETRPPEALGLVVPHFAVPRVSGDTMLVTGRPLSSSTEVVVYDAAGAKVAEAVPLRTVGEPRAAVEVGGNAVLWSTSGATSGVGELRRFRRDGRQVPSPMGTITGVGGYGHALVRVPDGILLFRGHAYLDKRVEVAKLTCPP